MLQLKALCFVEYRIGIGGLAKNAVDDVAKMLGQKVSTVRGWKRSLCMELGSVNVSRALFVAKKLGIQNHSRGLDENAQYGDALLRTLAEQYNTARKFRS